MVHYRVIVADNFHYMESETSYERGTFDTLEAAIGACREIVDLDLRNIHEPGMNAAELFTRYQHFGDDPFIVPLDGTDPAATATTPFSAWEYAKQQSEKICRTDP